MRRGSRGRAVFASAGRTARLASLARLGVPRETLLGRRSECETLARLLDAVREGESRTLVLLGELGVGKTALLKHLEERASGCRVAPAVGVQSEMELPFAGAAPAVPLAACRAVVADVARRPSGRVGIPPSARLRYDYSSRYFVNYGDKSEHRDIALTGPCR